MINPIKKDTFWKPQSISDWSEDMISEMPETTTLDTTTSGTTTTEYSTTESTTSATTTTTTTEPTQTTNYDPSAKRG